MCKCNSKSVKKHEWIIFPVFYKFFNWWWFQIWKAAEGILRRILTLRGLLTPIQVQLTESPKTETSQLKNGETKNNVESECPPFCVSKRPPFCVSEQPSSCPDGTGRDVFCEVLNDPEDSNMDIIFIHGLYGSLANTWKQGQWISKYKEKPTKILLRGSSSLETIEQTNRSTESIPKAFNNQCKCDSKSERNDIGETVADNNDNHEKYYTSKTYTENNYYAEMLSLEDYAKDLELENHDINSKSEVLQSVRIDKKVKDRFCEVGCGCFCERCYSNCWPKDWLSQDFPRARVISISYSKNPYLWRPLWIRSQKRANLEERANLMVRELVELGVGRNKIVWVGHSKGGLFIKQIFCLAYECFNKMKQKEEKMFTDNFVKGSQIISNESLSNSNNSHHSQANSDNSQRNSYTSQTNSNNSQTNSHNSQSNSYASQTNSFNLQTNSQGTQLEPIDSCQCSSAARLWSLSRGFMFYSVPHRGSNLADIKIPPLVFRSQDLLDISKDSAGVLNLHNRWLEAVESMEIRPIVHSLVETCDTLMALLWLRIVTAQSADANIGALYGVSVVDHREICKPSSRTCLLYTELIRLIDAAAILDCQSDR